MKNAACLLLAIFPFIANAQHSAIEPCGLKLYQARKAIYANDASRKLGLNTLTGSSNKELKKAWENWSECVRGKVIPSLDFTTIKGKRYRNSDLRGKVLVINFWFKSCAPCVAEMPSLNRLFNEFKNKDVVFIGFATDEEKDLKPLYFNSGKFLFDIVAGSGSIAEQFYFDGFPTSFIVDQNGRIAKAWMGNGIGVKDPYEVAKPVISELLSRRAK